MTKDSIQAEAMQAWLDADCIGTVVMGTGLGKTRLGGNIVRELHPSSTLVVTSRIPLLNHWRDEINLPGVDYMCINSAYKVSGEYDLLIVDECHRSISETFRSVYTNVKYKKLLCLTATLPEKNLEYLLNIAPVVYTKTIQDVEGTGIASPYQMYNLVTDMDKATAAKYNRFSQMFMEALVRLSKIKVDGFDTVFDLAKYFSTKSSKDEVVKYAKQYWSAMTMRRRVLQQNTAKIKVAHDLIEYLGPERKWLVLCSSTDYADTLATVLGTKVYHSKQAASVRSAILNSFTKGDLRILVAVKALNEGIDVPDADSLLVVSGDSTQLEAIQTLGRVIRAKHGKNAVIVNLTTAGTVEETWVNKRTKSFSPKWISDLKQIALPVSVG